VSFAVHHAKSVDDALALAARYRETGRFLAGGTDLIIQMQRGRIEPEHLIDLSPIASLHGIREEEDGFVIGALTTHKDIERYPGFRGALHGLVEAARVVGGHQIRNVGTIGGNVVNASPAADLVPVLLALNAEAVLLGAAGERRMPLAQFLTGPGLTRRRAEELLISIRLPRLPPGSATAFLKAGRRKAMEISVVCVAARLTLQDRRISTAALALGAVGPTGLRAGAAERFLEGRTAEPAVLAEAGRLAADAAMPVGDVRASAEHRRQIVPALIERALERCLERIEAAL